LFSYVNLADRVPARHPLRVIRQIVNEPRAGRPSRITLGADKGYDTEDFVNELRSFSVTPHAAAKVAGSALDRRPTRHAGYAASQRIEKAFGLEQDHRTGRPGPCCVASSASAPSSPSHSPDTISPDCRNCSPRDRARPGLGAMKEERRSPPPPFFSDLLESILVERPQPVPVTASCVEYDDRRRPNI
jgi:hypothetical protein